MSQIEQEIKRTLETATRVNSVIPSDELLQRLKQIPGSVKKGYDMVPKRMVWAAAASIALLIALNILSARTYSDSEAQNTNDETSVYFDYLNSL